MSSQALVTALLLTAGILAGAFLFFVQFSQLFALIFTAILVAVALDVPTSLIHHRVPRLPRTLALILVTLFLLAFWVGLGAWIGPQIASQLGELEQQVQLGLKSAGDWLATTQPFSSLKDFVPPLTDVAPPVAKVVQHTQSALISGLGIVTDFFIVVFVGYFIAANPKRYTRGLLLLIPSKHRESGHNVLLAIGRALRWWLVARLVLMLLIGTLFGTGLWILGIPLALPLAVIAALLTFIPYLGPVLAYVPALAVALLEGRRAALYVTIVYLSIQLVESYLAEPLIEAKTVTLPPGLIILAQVVCVMWLGFIGVLLATPLLIVAVVVVQLLYIRRVLGERVRVAGQH